MWVCDPRGAGGAWGKRKKLGAPRAASGRVGGAKWEIRGGMGWEKELELGGTQRGWVGAIATEAARVWGLGSGVHGLGLDLGLEFRVSSLGLGVWGSGLGLGFRVRGLGSWVWVSGSRVWIWGSRAWGLGLRV